MSTRQSENNGRITHLSPGLKSLAELVPSLLIGTVDDKNLSRAARSFAALSDNVAAEASYSTKLVGVSTVDIDLPNIPGCPDMKLLNVGTVTSDTCLRAGRDSVFEDVSGRFLVKSGTIVSVLAVVVGIMVSWLSSIFFCLGASAVFSGCKAFALWDLSTPSSPVVGAGVRRFSAEEASRLESWQALADFWTSLSRNGLFL